MPSAVSSHTSSKPDQSSHGGFTLIELLAVIAIVAVLASILFPVFSRARESARLSSCLSNLRQLGVATRMYLDDHNDTFPHNLGPRYRPSSVADVGLPRDDSSDPDSNRWDAGPVRYALEAYCSSPAVWYCPAIAQHDARIMESGVISPGVEDPSGVGVAATYQANAYIFVNTIPTVRVAGVDLLRPYPGPVRFCSITNPSNLRMYQDFWNRQNGVHFRGINTVLADGSARWQQARFGITNVAWWAP